MLEISMLRRQMAFLMMTFSARFRGEQRADRLASRSIASVLGDILPAEPLLAVCSPIGRRFTSAAMLSPRIET